jgi:serpin B
MKPIYFFLILALALGGCAKASASLSSSKPRLAPAAPQQDLDALAADNNAFAFDLYHAIAGGENNLLFSPYSLSQALAMMYARARAETAQEIADTLHFSLPQERLHPAFNALDLDLRSRASPPPESKPGNKGQEIGFELNIANAVWGQQGYPYRSEYLGLLAQNYGAGLQLVDFQKSAEEAVKVINHWVSEATNNRIRNILDSLDSDTRLVLANAVYFNAGWDMPFDEENTYSEPFHLLDGQTKNVDMMHQTESFPYSEGESWQAVELPYSNRDFGMAIILPREGQFRQIEEQMTGQWVKDVLQKIQVHEVILSMPKFRFETTAIQLRNTLSEMGMPGAFSSKADFSGISDEPLDIDSLLHKAFIQVDEKKTEAAAVTVLEEAPTGPAPELPEAYEMRIDRPFIFLIRDKRTNTILFVGRVMDPVER